MSSFWKHTANSNWFEWCMWLLLVWNCLRFWFGWSDYHQCHSQAQATKRMGWSICLQSTVTCDFFCPPCQRFCCPPYPPAPRQVFRNRVLGIESKWRMHVEHAISTEHLGRLGIFWIQPSRIGESTGHQHCWLPPTRRANDGALAACGRL